MQIIEIYSYIQEIEQKIGIYYSRREMLVFSEEEQSRFFKEGKSLKKRPWQLFTFLFYVIKISILVN